jgi:amino-acid N-acetyltransferase
MDGYAIESANESDMTEITDLLRRSNLPTEDLDHGAAASFLLVRSDALIGAVAVQVLGSCGLLRSLVVDERVRHCRLGALLSETAEARARRAGVTELYLLTTTAAPFFAARGYQPVPRDSAPPTIAATRQFSSLCPSVASFMRKQL